MPSLPPRAVAAPLVSLRGSQEWSERWEPPFVVAVNLGKQDELILSRLKELLSYDPETGIFIRKITTGWRSQAGMRAGGTASHQRGYSLIRVDTARYLAHRLAWFYVYGEWPEEIDHIDGDAGNNAIANLRHVSHLQNTWNSSVRSHNKFGHRNIRPNGRKFQVSFSSANKRIFHKSYPSLDAAIVARDQTARLLYGEFSPLNRSEN